jgi:hypothetical protein
MIGDWVNIQKLNCYLTDVRELTMSLYVLFMKLEQGADNHLRKDHCKSIDDTRNFECNVIGMNGRAKYPRHHQLSKILNLLEFFDPMMLDESLMFRVHGTPSNLTLYGCVKVRHRFLKTASHLQVGAIGLTFVPGGS